MEKGTQFKVLNHGYVKFIDSMGTDESIIEAARMSTGRGFEGWEKDAGLLDYLWRKMHSSPFEMCELKIEVQAPIMVFREWHRHRTQSYNEFSARYAQMPNVHYLPEKTRIKKQDKVNKQSSSEAIEGEFASQIISELERQQEEVYGTYDAWVENGLAKEIARLNTPVSRFSKMVAKTDLLNWLKFLNLRMRPSAQWEIRQYANIVGDIIRNKFPKTWELFEEYDLYGVRLSRTEISILREIVEGSKAIGHIEERAQDLNLTGNKLSEFIQKIKEGGRTIL